MPRLNSRLPLLWRTPTSCQFGSLDPVAILRDTTVNEERALAVLREGTSLATLRALVGQWHMTPEELDDLAARPFVSLCRLGPRILRAETAAVAGLAALQALAGDWAE
jgi:16S rRNA (uracil1498-N3)-methyltransferase